MARASRYLRYSQGGAEGATETYLGRRTCTTRGSRDVQNTRMTNGKLNGHEREQLALEVQAEALRPTPKLNSGSLQDKLTAAFQRIRQLEDRIIALQKQKRENREQFQREVAKQRTELGINEQRTRVTT